MTRPGEAPAATIIMVEDKVLVRTEIADYLRSCGYRVIEAANAAEACTVLGDSSISVDVVLSAAEMHGEFSGFALRQWIMQNRPDVDVILAGTPARTVDTAADLCRAGPAASGAYDPDGVHDRIKRLLAARKPARRTA